MGLRDALARNPVVVAGASAAVLVIALVVVAIQLDWGASRFTEADAVYFWDTGADDLFVVEGIFEGPIEAPSGGEGLRAHMFSCGRCTADEWFGYVETYSETYQRAAGNGSLERMNPPDRQRFEMAHQMIRPIEGDRWVEANSRAGQEVRDRILGRCDSADQLTRCLP